MLTKTYHPLSLVDNTVTTSKFNAWSALKADTHRLSGRYAFSQILYGLLQKRTFRVIFTLRLCQMAAESVGILKYALPIFKILHRMTTQFAGMDLPWKTKIAPGFALPHGWGLVVSTHAKIGKNVTLFQGVTIGQRDKILSNGRRYTEFPVIEDEVWVGPNAVIVGGVTIGKGSRIAAGAFVTNSIPPYSIVIGNPANIVKRNCIPDVMNSAPV